MIPVQLVPGAPEPDSLPDQKEVCPDKQTSKLMIRQRRGKLFNELDLSGFGLMGTQNGRQSPPAPSQVS